MVAAPSAARGGGGRAVGVPRGAARSGVPAAAADVAADGAASAAASAERSVVSGAAVDRSARCRRRPSQRAGCNGQRREQAGARDGGGVGGARRVAHAAGRRVANR
eukprot:363159-Chlamydomonas_euryale.AAC.6